MATDEQILEVESLEAIYGPDVVELISRAGGGVDATSDTAILRIRLPVELGRTTLVKLIQSDEDGVEQAAFALKLRLGHLPPVLLELLLPAAYPASSPPQINMVGLDSATPFYPITSLRQRLGALLDQAYDQSECLWVFLETVREGHFLDRPVSADEIILRPALGVDVAVLGDALSKYEAERTGQTFSETTYPCGICLENRKGRLCVEFDNCRHVFCRDCIKSCFSLAIREGDVLSVSCPSVDCIKARLSKVTESSAVSIDDEEANLGAIVLDLLGAEAKKRWLWLKEKRQNDADVTRLICPQPSCQASVPAPTSALLADSDPDGLRVPNGWDRFRQCPSCGFSFCAYCSSTWHGPHTLCQIGGISRDILRYYDLGSDDPARLQLEARYGKKNLEKLAAKAREDDENRKWLEANTRNCPGCQVATQKSVGCNHMTCTRCEAHFCFKCGASLSPLEPYKHFNTPGTPCFMRLFDEADVNAWAGGGAVWDDGAFR